MAPRSLSPTAGAAWAFSGRRPGRGSAAWPTGLSPACQRRHTGKGEIGAHVAIGNLTRASAALGGTKVLLAVVGPVP